MKKLIRVSFLLFFSFQNIIGQITFTDLGGLEVVENAKEHKKLIKEWNNASQAIGTKKMPILLHEGTTTLFFSIGKNVDFPNYEKIYAFDKQTMKVKFAYFNKESKDRIVHSVRFHKDDIFVFYLVSEKRTDKKGYSIRISCKKNNEPEKYYADYLEESPYNVLSVSASCKMQDIIASTSKERFLFLEGKGSGNVKVSVVDKNLDKEDSFIIKLAKPKNKSSKGVSKIEIPIYYDKIKFDDKENLIYFINERLDENNSAIFVEIMIYDINKKKFSEATVYYNYEDLGFYSKKIFEPLVNYTIVDNDFYIYGVAFPKEKSKSKYSNVQREVILYKISLENSDSIIHTSKVSISDNFFAFLEDSKGIYLDKHCHAEKISMEENGNMNYLKIDYYRTVHSYGNTINNLPIPNSDSYEVGGILLSVEDDKLEKTTAIPLFYNTMPVFYKNGKIYQLKENKRTYTLLEIDNNQEKNIFSIKQKAYIYLDDMIGEGNGFVLYKSESGLAKIDLIEKN